MLITLTVVFVISTQIIIANAIGINIIDLLRQKTDSLTNQTVISSNDALEQAKKETLEETSMYVDSYIEDIKQSLDQYTNSELEVAKLKLKQKAQDVKDTLEANKTQAIEGSKIKIKIKIDEKVNDKLSELDNEISIKIQEKFK